MQNELSSIASFLDGSGRLTQMPAKYRKKLIVIRYLAEKFEPGREYTEPKVNFLLEEQTLFHDPATLRRALCDTALLLRTRDCRRYWRIENLPSFEEFVNANL